MKFSLIKLNTAGILILLNVVFEAEGNIFSYFPFLSRYSKGLPSRCNTLTQPLPSPIQGALPSNFPPNFPPTDYGPSENFYPPSVINPIQVRSNDGAETEDTSTGIGGALAGLVFLVFKFLGKVLSFFIPGPIMAILNFVLGSFLPAQTRFLFYML